MSLLGDNFNKKPEYSYGINKSGNLIIHGDNCIITEMLYEKYRGKVKCIYIDPPYNNGESYTHYEDSLEHEVWLENMENILFSLKPLLHQDGSIWISIDDSEMHYLKVLCDKIFGRKNFITTIVWQHRTTRENRKVFSNNHEYILVYAIDPIKFKAVRNQLPSTETVLSRYKNPDNDPRGLWQSISLNVQAGHAVRSQFYEIVAPNGKRHNPPNGRCWIYNQDKMKKEMEENNIWFGIDGNGVPRRKKFLSNSSKGITPETLWLANEVGTTKKAKKHMLNMFPDNPVFDTPKPEELIKRIIDIATNKGDLVLDAFLGSGTTAAVAHKMNRYYIGIERENHIFDIVCNRLKMVVDGEDGGISNQVNWTGGGGFDVYDINEIRYNI